jgi:hypothetical protein
MALPFKLNKPPADANDSISLALRKWLNDAYLYCFRHSAVIPAGGLVGNQPPIYGGRRNHIDNGDFQIWQRGTSITATGGASDYTADRWAITRAVGTQILSRQLSGLSGFQYCARVERSAADATTANIYIAQAIETVRTIPLAGRPVTLSGWFRTGSGFSGALTVQLQGGTGTDQGPLAAFTGGFIIITYPLASAVNTTWTYFSISSEINSTANELKVYLQNTPPAIAGANNYYEVTGLQLEVGPKASAFDYMPFHDQLKICERYFQKSFVYGTAPATAAGNAGIVQYVTDRAAVSTDAVWINLPVRMRTAPTVTFFNPAAANANWRNITRVGDSAAGAASGTGDNSFAITNAQVAADVVNQLCGIHYTASADL